jgi:hypothetical protein
MSIRSVHSRRTVPTQRSANEFARGACGGVLITSMPSAANTVSKGILHAPARYGLTPDQAMKESPSYPVASWHVIGSQVVRLLWAGSKIRQPCPRRWP